MFPEKGTDVPFTIRNYAYRDVLGRETETWYREFEFPKPRRFDAAMIYSEERDRIVDYLGTRHHMVVDIDAWVDEETRGMRIETGAQRLLPLGQCIPFPRALTGKASVHEWYDEANERYRIEVCVENPYLGTLFEYRGSFDVEWIECDESPADVLPTVTRRRE